MKIPIESLYQIDDNDTGFYAVEQAEKNVKLMLHNIKNALDNKFIRTELIEINGIKFAKAIHNNLELCYTDPIREI